MARAAANPQAKNYGTNILGIVGKQSDYDTPFTLADPSPSATQVKSKSGAYANLNPYLIEFRPPYTLTPIKQFYPVERLKGNPSPDPSIPGMEMGAGELHFYLNPTSIPFWMQALLQTTTVTSRAFEDKSISSPGITSLAQGASADEYGTAQGLATGKQPKDIIAGIRTSPSANKPKPPEGMRAGQIKLTFGTTTQDIIVRGTDQNGTSIEDVLRPARAGDGSKTARTTQTTERYFQDNVTVAAKGGDSALAVSGVDLVLSKVFEHSLSFVSGVGNGLSLEVQEGNPDTPITYQGLLVSRGILRLEPVCRASFQVIANKVFPRQALHGGAGGTIVTHFQRHDFHAVPNLGMLWEIGTSDDDDRNNRVPSHMRGSYRLASIGLAIDNRLAPPATSYADNFFYPKPVRKMNRELQFQLAVDHSENADFDSFVGGLTFPMKMHAISRPYGGPYRSVEVDAKAVQLVANPTRQVPGVGEVLQMIVGRLHIDTTANDEATIKFINTESTI